ARRRPWLALANAVPADGGGDDVLLVHQMIVEEIARLEEILQGEGGKRAAALEESIHRGPPLSSDGPLYAQTGSQWWCHSRSAVSGETGRQTANQSSRRTVRTTALSARRDHVDRGSGTRRRAPSRWPARAGSPR